MKYKPANFHKLVFKVAKEITESYFRSDIRNWIGNIFTGIFTGYAVPYLLSRLGDMTMPNAWLQLLVIIVSSLLGMALFILLVLGWNVVWTVPAKLYHDKEILLANRSWYDVEFEPIHFTDHGRHVAGLRIRNNKSIEITELNLKTYTIWEDGKKIAEQRDMYWSGPDGWLHYKAVQDVLSPNGGEGIVPIAIGTSKEAYLDEITSSMNGVEDISRRVYFEAGITYYIDITLIARMETVKIPTPYPFFKGTLLYDPPKVILTKDSVTPQRPGHEV